MKQLGELLPPLPPPGSPPGWDVMSVNFLNGGRYPFIHVGGERETMRSKISCLRKQHDGRDQQQQQQQPFYLPESNLKD